MRHLIFALVCFGFVFTVPSLNGQDSRLMTEAEYKKFLNDVDAELPAWEASLKKIDPEKANTSYVVGKQIVDNRDIALMQLNYTREWLAKQRTKHTVSGEFQLDGFLRGITDSVDSVVVTEIISGVTLSDLEKYAKKMGALRIKIANDLNARIELLDKGTCP